MNVFVYGSLMNPEVRDHLVNKGYNIEKGRLLGHKRVRLNGYSFPAIYPNQEQSVDGQILLSIDDESLRALDEFESEFYIREKVTVKAESGSTVECFAYVYDMKDMSLLTDKAWSNKEFRQNHMQNMVNRCFKDGK